MPATPEAHVLFRVRAHAPERHAVASGTGSAIVTERTGKMPPSPRYAQDKVWKRLRLKAQRTRRHSPAAAEIPGTENWRKPGTSLMMPITGSTVRLRAP